MPQSIGYNGVMNNTLSPALDFGRINTLRIDRFAAPGAYLMAEDGSDVLLPNQYVTDEMQIDDLLDVFVYTDSEDRPVATTGRPTALRDEFVKYKTMEWDAYHLSVSPWEVERYSHLF